VSSTVRRIFVKIDPVQSVPEVASEDNWEMVCESIWSNDTLHNLEHRRDKRVQIRSGGGCFASFASLFVIE
jgi:hypothetical protein